jgi:hypothetical protein
MSETAGTHRPAEAIERDFLDVRAATLPFQVSADKFERLWDEINDAAASLLPDEDGMPYLALLRQLQDEFDRLKRNAYLARISGIRWNARW